MSATKPHIYCLYGIWHVVGGDDRSWRAAYEFVVRLNWAASR